MWNLNYPNYCGSGLLGEQNIWLLQLAKCLAVAGRMPAAGPVMMTTFPLRFIFFSHSQVARLDIFPLRKLLRRGGVDNLPLAHDVDVVSHFKGER